MAFKAGTSLSWHFNSDEKRLRLTLPEEFGGCTYELPLLGGYTLSPLEALSEAEA